MNDKSNFYKDLISNAPYAYACVEKKCNTNEKSEGFVLIDVNPCFCKLIKTRYEKIINQQIENIELLSNMDFKKLFIDVMEKRDKIVVKKYLPESNQWYQIIIYAFEKKCIALLLIELEEDKDLILEYGDLMLSVSDSIIEFDNNFIIRTVKTDKPGAMEKIVGKDIFQVFGKQIASQYINAFEKARNKGTIAEIEYKDVLPDTDCIWNRARIHMKRKDKESGFIAIISDITKEKIAELELRIKTEELELFFEILPGLLCAVDYEGNIVKFNKAWKDIMGYSPEELKTMNIKDIIHPDDFFSTIRAIKELKERKGFKQHVSRFKKKDGSYCYFSWNSCHDGECFYCIASDISKIKNFEKELLSQKKFLKTLIDTIPDYIYYKDKEGRILGCNKVAAEDIYKLQEKDIIGKTDIEIHDNEFSKTCMQYDKKVLKHKKTFIYEEEHKSPEKNMWFETIKTPFYNDEGEISGIIGVSRDITNRLISQEKIRDSEERFRQLAENIEEAFWLSTDKEMLYISPGFERIWDRSSECIYKDISNLRNYIYKEDKHKILKILKAKEYREKGYFNEKYRIVKPDGTLRWVWEKIFPIRDNKGKIIRRAGIIEDITTLKIAEEVVARTREEMMQVELRKKSVELQQLGELEKLRTDFFANLSHELRTPINLILAALKMIEIRADESETEDKSFSNHKYLKIMKQNSYRLMRLINNLIDVTRLDAGFLSFNASTWDIIYIIKSITHSVAMYAKSKNISLSFESELEIFFFKCDPDKIERILLNLLSNAIKYNKDKGSIKVSVSKCNNELLISVSDTGIGIPKDKLNLIFERFKQVDSRLTKEGEGSGIGLSLVKAFVEMHGGRITVDSILGVGTDFSIRIPVDEMRDNNNDRIMENEDCEDLRIERIKMEFSDIYGIEF